MRRPSSRLGRVAQTNEGAPDEPVLLVWEQAYTVLCRLILDAFTVTATCTLLPSVAIAVYRYSVMRAAAICSCALSKPYAGTTDSS